MITIEVIVMEKLIKPIKKLLILKKDKISMRKKVEKPKKIN